MFNNIPVERFPEECSTQHGFQSAKHLLVKTKQLFICTFSKKFYDEFSIKEEKAIENHFANKYNAQYSSVCNWIHMCSLSQ